MNNLMVTLLEREKSLVAVLFGSISVDIERICAEYNTRYEQDKESMIWVILYIYDIEPLRPIEHTEPVNDQCP